MAGKRYYSTGQLAKKCSITKHTVLATIGRGELPAAKTPGGHHRIAAEDAEAFMRRHNIPVEDREGRGGIRAKGGVLVFCAEAVPRAEAAGTLRAGGELVEEAGNAFEAGIFFERLEPAVFMAVVEKHPVSEELLSILWTLRRKEAGTAAAASRILLLGPECDARETARLRADGVHDFLTFPYKPRDLCERVKTLRAGRAAVLYHRLG